MSIEWRCVYETVLLYLNLETWFSSHEEQSSNSTVWYLYYIEVVRSIRYWWKSLNSTSRTDSIERKEKSRSVENEFCFAFKENVSNPFSVGMKLEAVDLIAPELICVATIGQIAKNLVRIHFDGWTNDFDQWIDCQSANIYPVGWCQFVGHDLEPPKEKTNETCLKTEKPNKIQRSKKFNSRKSNKRKRIWKSR